MSSQTIKLLSADIANNIAVSAGQIFFVRDRSLLAQPFDTARLELTGKPEVLAAGELEGDLAFSRFGFSVSNGGLVLFQSTSDNASGLVWFDRGGKELESVGDISSSGPNLSRDGRLLTFSADDDRNGKHFVRVYDMLRGTSTRITNGGSDVCPVFSPDAKQIAYLGDRNSVYVVPIDNSKPPERLDDALENDWLADGRFLLYVKFREENFAPQLSIYDFQAHTHHLFTDGGAEAQFSPDGKWVAFTGPPNPSAQSSDPENYFASQIFVAPFPGPGGRLQVSTTSGAQPRWRADGKELYYIDLDGNLVAVPIAVREGKLVPGVPKVLFRTRIVGTRVVLFQYAVSADGKRFLINSLPQGTAPLTILSR